MSEAEIRDWAWEWAKRLKSDIQRTQEFFDDIQTKCGDLTENDRKKYSTVLALTVTAYYEFATRKWTKERSATQCDAMSKLLKDIMKGHT